MIPASLNTMLMDQPVSGGAFLPTDLGAKLEGWYDASDAGTLTISGGLVTTWNDKSAKLNHLTTTGLTAPTYFASDPLMNGSPSVGNDDVTLRRGCRLFTSVTYKDIYFIVRYKGGLEATFDTFNALMTGTLTGAAPRILGDSTTANIRVDAQSFNSSIQKNNGSISNVVLPMPICLLKVAASASTSIIPTFLCNRDVDGRSWTGAISEFVAVNTTLTTSEENDLKNYLYSHNGITP